MTATQTAMESVKLEENGEVNKKEAGAFLRAEREKRKWSRDDLAEKTGYSRNMIYLLETQGEGSNDLITALADALGYKHTHHHNFTPKS